MRKRMTVVLLAATAVAAVFILPAQAGGNDARAARAYGVRGLVRSARSLGVVSKPKNVNVAWVSASTMPVAVEETGGGAAVQNSFYVPGGYKNFNCDTGTCLNNTVQTYKKASNAWQNDTANPIPPVPGLQPGLADAASCWDPVGRMLHIVDGVAYDATGAGFLIRQHLTYNPAAPTGTRWAFLSGPVDSLGNSWFGQDQGCAFIGGKMYLFGGYGIVQPSQPQAVIENLTWVYDPSTDTWSDTGRLMQHGRIWMGYTSNTTNAFAAGGSDNINTFAPIASTEKFTPASGWVATANLPTALLAPGEGVVQTHLLIWGGGNSSFAPQNKTYHCVLPNCSAMQTTAFNLPSAKWFSAFGAGSSVFNAGGDTGTGVPVNTAEHLP